MACPDDTTLTTDTDTSASDLLPDVATKDESIYSRVTSQALVESVVSAEDARRLMIEERLQVDPMQAWLISNLLEDDWYHKTYDLEPDEDSLVHYLSVGVYSNYDPGCLFNCVHTQKQLLFHQANELAPSMKTPINSGDSVSDLPILLDWLQQGFQTISPTPWFDASYYLQQYSDLRDIAEPPFLHFVNNGLEENRNPSEFVRELSQRVYVNFGELNINVHQLLQSVPVTWQVDFITTATQNEIRKLFIAPLYRAQIQAETAISDDALFAHYLSVGGIQGLRPNPLFNVGYYKEQIASNQVTGFNDFLNPFLHWYFEGRKQSIVPTPLFDSEYYLAHHKDIRTAWKSHPFDHYIENGVSEPFRKASTFFDSNYYLRNTKANEYALLDYLLTGQFTGLQPVEGFDLDLVPDDNSFTSSPLENAAWYLQKRTDSLKRGELGRMVQRATELEPQLVRPYGVRHIRMAPLFHPEVELMRVMRKVVAALKKTQYESIVLIPHCRMAGSAKIAGKFTTILSEITSAESVLIVHTDMSVFERPDWFPDDVDVFDFSQFLGDVCEERKVRLLLDLVRGLKPNRLINVNSNLGWRLTTTYGRQLSYWMKLYFYLFCWDLDVKGNKGGYPIQWFLPTFDYATGVFTDSYVLRDELHQRYCMTEASKGKIVALHTPAEDTEIRYDHALNVRQTINGKRRIFWSGRFDRQKRVDIFCQIATEMPDVEFWVWGKPVMNDAGFADLAFPDNVRLMGHYTNIDDVPIASCDCFLYTAGWDGLPTVLIEVGSRGIPVVASAVGGVIDLIQPHTGWPVKEADSAHAYIEAIRELLGDYNCAIERAQHLREHTLQLCNENSYKQNMRLLIEV